MIDVPCKCGKILKAPDKTAGRKAKCPKCGAALIVPDLAPAIAEYSITPPVVDLPEPDPEPNLQLMGSILDADDGSAEFEPSTPSVFVPAAKPALKPYWALRLLVAGTPLGASLVFLAVCAGAAAEWFLMEQHALAIGTFVGGLGTVWTMLLLADTAALFLSMEENSVKQTETMQDVVLSLRTLAAKQVA